LNCKFAVFDLLLLAFAFAHRGTAFRLCLHWSCLRGIFAIFNRRRLSDVV
jgi:hypothetical protein